MDMLMVGFTVSSKAEHWGEKKATKCGRSSGFTRDLHSCGRISTSEERQMMSKAFASSIIQFNCL